MPVPPNLRELPGELASSDARPSYLILTININKAPAGSSPGQSAERAACENRPGGTLTVEHGDAQDRGHGEQDPAMADSPALARARRRAVIAATVGTAIEWYDFFLYGVAAALVFPERFFPQSDPLTGSLLAFSTYFVGFLSRPLGAALFGHYGDRLGRKASLVATLLLMGLSTMGIGLIPDHASIGIAGAFLLTLLRAVQGIAVGGEWAGSVLLATEWGSDRARGLSGSWPQLGAPAGLVLANGALLGMTYVAGPGFVDWGWRVPFLASALLIGVGLYIRVGILETPVFARLRASGRVARTPIREVVQRCGREVLLTALVRTGQQAPAFIFVTYVLSYATTRLGYSRSAILYCVTLQSLLSLFTVPLFGHLSDRIGRRRTIAFGCALMTVWPFAYFAMLDSGISALVFLAILLAVPLHDIQNGPQAALIAETFPARLRYSGASLGYQLASIVSGGPAPLIAVSLLARFGTSHAIAAYLSLCAVVSLLALWALPARVHGDEDEARDASS
jgi:MFS family permease